MPKKWDFSGYATRSGVKCGDGRTILKNAFAHQDGKEIPLVYQHVHDNIDNVLGHCLLENRDDGVYCYGSFNNTPKGKMAKEMVEHGDLNSLSIWANNLVEKAKEVMHGDIREVSLVLAGANKGAFIDNLCIEHSDGTSEDLNDEAIIHFEDVLKIGEGDGSNNIQHAASADPPSGKTFEEIFKTMSPDQKEFCYGLMGMLVTKENDVEHSGLEGGGTVSHNVFDGTTKKGKELTHDAFLGILEEAKEGGSFKKAVLAHAEEYGVKNVEYLFGDPKLITNPPDWIKRDTDWVAGIINGVSRSPFAKFKTMAADITGEEARARGYTTGNVKKNEIFSLLQRDVGPTTIYKKQKIDRDTLLDITELNYVTWLWGEMRLMFNEEFARAILISDGRPVELSSGGANPDKIDESKIKPIWKDSDLYAHHVQIPAGTSLEGKIEYIVKAKKELKGSSGSPKFYTHGDLVTDILLMKDKIGRRLYRTEAEVASELRVSGIVDVPVMDNQIRTDEDGKKWKLIGIIVNIKDYRVGTDRGGEIATFEDFDLNYNQYYYLMECRCSGMLIHPKSALVIEEAVEDKTEEGTV